MHAQEEEGGKKKKDLACQDGVGVVPETGVWPKG